jgi:hypothetical protein
MLGAFLAWLDNTMIHNTKKRRDSNALLCDNQSIQGGSSGACSLPDLLSGLVWWFWGRAEDDGVTLLRQWFSASGHFSYQGIFDNFWRDFWSLWLGEGRCATGIRWEETRDAGKYPTMHKTVLYTENEPDQHVSVLLLRNPESGEYVFGSSQAKGCFPNYLDNKSFQH